MREQTHDDFGGLSRDLHRLLGRRRALQVFGGLTLGGFAAACSEDSPTAVDEVQPTSTASASTAGASTGSTAAEGNTSSTLAADIEATAGPVIPDETAGPFPADGTNGPNLLETSGVVRQDMTTSIGDQSGRAPGVPIIFDLAIVDAATGNPRPGAAVYLWQCTADGRYSIYETDENYLRAVQSADDAGRLTFTSIFPGCYPSRWPHAHFEVFESLEAASNGSAAIKTSQLALPEADCATVFADDMYGNSSSNLAGLSLETDGVFADGWTDQLAAVSGSLAAGYTASLLVRV